MKRTYAEMLEENLTKPLPIKKLRCKDGIVRRFQTCRASYINDNFNDIKCLECDANFGVHSFCAVKEKLKAHICEAKI